MTASPAGSRGRTVGNYAWAVADQVLSSGTNFLVAVLVARLVGPKGYGVFVLVLAIWILVLGLGRALLMQPYILRAAPASRKDWLDETRLGAGAVLTFGAAAGAVLVAVGFGVGHSSVLGGSLVVVGTFSAPLMLQEFWRIASFSRGSARTAFVNDAVWAAAQLALLLWFAQRGDLDTRRALLAWGVGALAGALVGPIQHRVLPVIARRTAAWSTKALHLGSWFGADVAVYALGEQAAIWIIAAIAGTAALGGLRSVQNLFGPMSVLSLAAESVTLPRAANAMAASGKRGVIKVAGAYGAVLTAGIAVYVLVVVLVGGDLLTLVFGDEYAEFAELIIPLGLAAVCGGVVAGASLGLRASRNGKSLAVGTITGAAVKAAVVFAFTFAWTTLGAAWALAASAAIGGLILWYMLTRDRPSQTPGEADSPVPDPTQRDETASDQSRTSPPAMTSGA